MSPKGEASKPPKQPWEFDEDPEQFNIASYLPARAAERPYQRAIIVPEGYNALGLRSYSHLNFRDLDRLADRYAFGLQREGLQRGDRVLLMVRAGFELIAVTFALFKIGAVPVMIDPGMGRTSFLSCVRSAQPTALIGIPLAHALRKVFRAPFDQLKLEVSTSEQVWVHGPSLNKMPPATEAFPVADTGRDELAAILFTSGSTGPPKGVEYTQGIFGGQVRAIQRMYGIEPGEIEVTAFPMFSLFSIAMGVSCVIPDMDPTKPARVDPAKIVEAIADHGADAAFGSPAIWKRVARYCLDQNIGLPSLKRILTAGAAIDPWLMEAYARLLSEGACLHTPFGATESLPVATFSSAEVLAETQAITRQGKGICVGAPVEEVEVAIIAIDDEVLPDFKRVEQLEDGQIGEICVSGPMVTRRYDNNPRATAMAKIFDRERGDGAFWHRMGDVGYLDEKGRIWYCGRKAHRVETPEGTLFTICCEAIFNDHAQVARSALIGLGQQSEGLQRPAIVIELEHPAEVDRELLRGELLALAAEHEQTRPIELLFFHDNFPVDRRHNSKIHREELAAWAASELEPTGRLRAPVRPRLQS